ncbi:MAG: DUF1730 domain-containing protein [Candidatus Hydrogenedentota bacterium]|nr:MAG: DUF1730 domain-containing protein [Candidatus Hydrogenedentota bacterium]
MSKAFREEELAKIHNALIKEGFFAGSWICLERPSIEFRKFYKDFLRKAKFGILNYLQKYRLKMEPWRMLKGASSAFILLAPYITPSSKALKSKLPYKISLYAYGKDYHRVLKKRAKKVLLSCNQDHFRIITDSTPFPERYFARQAGLGFIGKNGMLIHPHRGSYFFITVILFQKKLPNSYKKNAVGKPQDDINRYCKDCTRCIDACPTGALVGDGTLDINLCISTITIEDKLSQLSYPDQSKNHKWIFGCDVCQQVCPYNHEPVLSSWKEFDPALPFEQLLTNPTRFEESILNGTALKRAGLKKLQENIQKLYNT